MSARGKVLFVASTFPRWIGDSSAPFVLHLALDLRALGWDVHVLAPHAPGALRREVLDGVPVERFRYLLPERLQTVCYGGGALINLRARPLDLMKVPVLVAREWGAVAARLRRERYDLVHSHWIVPQGFVCAVAARSAGVPHVTTVHGGDVFTMRGRIVSAFKRYALKYADAITVNSSATERAVLELLPGAAHVTRIPIGATAPHPPDEASVSAIRERCGPAAGPLLVFVGRLIEEKGADDLLDAVALLKSTSVDVRAIVVGDGPHRGTLEQRARAVGVADRVFFAGWQPAQQVAAYLAAGDLFVAPSRRSQQGWIEAQGVAIVEAMLAGMPVIASSSGGIVDSVRHEETGLLIPERDPQALSAAILRLHGDARFARQLGDAARQRALSGFTRESSARRFSDLYDRLTAAFPRPGALRR